MADGTIRVALVGCGNCASALVQGLAFYGDAAEDAPVPGLMNARLGRYHVRDVEGGKVGLDLAEALLAAPNDTIRFAQVPPVGVTVRRGPTLDGIGRYLADLVQESPEPVADVTRELRESGAEVVVSYLPVGSQAASEWYAERALEAGCAYVNCIPVFLAADAGWAGRFAARGVPIVGDDVKSQVGATIVHRVLANLFRERGVRLERTYQLNFGGNTDFLNMLERERLVSKKVSKTRAVTSQVGTPMPADSVHVGPSDHVPWLTDRKVAYIRLEGAAFGGVPLSAEIKLEVWDSPNSAGVVIDAIRCARIGLDRGIGGPLEAPSAWFMKSPPRQFTDAEALARTVRFVTGEDGSRRRPALALAPDLEPVR